MPYWPEIERPRLQGNPYQAWRQMGLNEMLLDNRIIFLDLPMDPRIMINGSTVCSHIIKSMLYLATVKRDQDIQLYINCPGGDIDDTLAIYDTMRFLNCDVATYCVGAASSGAALILAAGTKGKRFALPHAKVMIHQPWGYVGGQAADMRIQAEEILKVKKTLIDIMSLHTGKSPEQIEKDTERDRYMDVKEALEYGLIDEILSERPDKRKK
ncbi:MAG: ATP-dependent Clp protease proteolytic subunit [Phycisphaerae bacterium]|jgi:ATP-dependent Clp protease protease subunit|nr:ATP-dependent Clp protease proteolytic subunit [Phycisphaerae bacterium]MCZ2400227.1 ATP-dependent Clp protease proteolytic subunit [Phycisphaerae bacterium]NUQ49476.1 ATP-dependent Clp protease proteolytic subunit [Phycisphaerae bacterium]